MGWWAWLILVVVAIYGTCVIALLFTKDYRDNPMDDEMLREAILKKIKEREGES